MTATTARLVKTAAIAILLTASACGSSGPTEPSGDESANTYIGVLAVPGGGGLGGIVQLQASEGATASRPFGTLGVAFNRLLDQIVPSLWAQATVPATGTLVTDSAQVVQLTGTVADGLYQVGGGGYTISAAVDDQGSVSGSGSAPGGLSASLSPAASPPATSPVPNNPSGSYTGTFEINTVLRHRNTNTQGAPMGGCNLNIVMNGTLAMEIESLGDGRVEAHLTSSWQERGVPGGSCTHQHTTLNLGPSGLDFIGPASNLQLGRTESGTVAQGIVTRTEGFSGAISGNTIVGTVYRAFNYTTPIPGGTHMEAWPTSTTTVTLTKQQ